ncbi:MAG: methylated-DNA--[protein]-cysteine S-methyltransferase [bacterium]
MHDFLKLKLSPYWIGVIFEKGKLAKISICYSQKDLYSSLRAAGKGETGSSSLLKRLKQDLLRYWQGGKVYFTTYPLKLDGYSSFQREVWRLTQGIPYGEVRSYKWIARRMGSKGYRAVGQALAHNPFPLIIPCHRVIREERSIGGFSAGADIKRKLLKREGIYLACLYE